MWSVDESRSQPCDSFDLDPGARLEQRADLDQRHRRIVAPHAAPVVRADQLARRDILRPIEDVDGELPDRFGSAAGVNRDRHQAGERLIELLIEAIAHDPAGGVPSALPGEQHYRTAPAATDPIAVAARLRKR